MKLNINSQTKYYLAYSFSFLGLLFYLPFAISDILYWLDYEPDFVVWQILFYVIFISAMLFLITGFASKNPLKVFRQMLRFFFIMAIVYIGFVVESLLYYLLGYSFDVIANVFYGILGVGSVLAYIGLKNHLMIPGKHPKMFYAGVIILVLALFIQSIIYAYLIGASLSSGAVYDLSNIDALITLGYLFEPIGLLFFTIGTYFSYSYFVNKR